MDKLQSLDWRGIYKSAKNSVKKYSLNITDLEVKVEDATSNETWGPHGSVMTEIAEAAFDSENYRQIMGVIARRLQERDDNWRMCYKALLLLEFLIKQGPTKVVNDVVSSASVLERLQNFQHKDLNGKDLGTNVRHRAKEISDLVNNPDRVKEEREKAKANRAKYTGASASQMRSGATSFGSSASASASPARPLGGGASRGHDRGASWDGARSSLGGGGGLGAAAPASGGASVQTGSEEREFLSFAKRPSKAGSSGLGAEEVDPLAATRARIERLKLGGQLGAGDGRPDAAAPKKKLTLADVKVNPRIAASLGLSVASSIAKPAAAATGPSLPPPPEGVDLLGGLLDDPAPAPSNGTAASASSGDGWDAFGTAAPAVPAAVPLAGLADLLPAAAPHEPVFNPFGTASATPLPGLSSSPAAATDPFALASVSLGGLAPPAPSAAAKPAATMGVRKSQALPEDMFANLTGIGRPSQPMGQPSGLQMQPPPLAAPAAGLAPAAGFAAFGGMSLPAAVAPPVQQAPAPGRDPFEGLLL